MTTSGATSKDRRFPRRYRLAHALQFKAVFDAKVKKSSGAIAVFGCPNALPYPRLGLSVGRPVGNAVTRNRVKRIVREAFREIRADIPMLPDGMRGEGSLDLIVAARRGAPETLDDMRPVVVELIRAVHRVWERRAARGGRS